jgi:hypothetical protein
VKEKEDYFSYTGKKGASMLPYKYSVEVDDTEYKVYSIMTKK